MTSINTDIGSGRSRQHGGPGLGELTLCVRHILVAPFSCIFLGVIDLGPSDIMQPKFAEGTGTTGGGIAGGNSKNMMGREQAGNNNRTPIPLAEDTILSGVGTGTAANASNGRRYGAGLGAGGDAGMAGVGAGYGGVEHGDPQTQAGGDDASAGTTAPADGAQPHMGKRIAGVLSEMHLEIMTSD